MSRLLDFQIVISPSTVTLAASVSLLIFIAMSVTTTANPLTGRTLEVLGDYELHHSGSSPSQSAGPRSDRSNSTASTQPSTQASIPNPRVDTAQETVNPPGWPDDHRRVPAYRPIDRNLDYEQRTAGLNGPEYVFIQSMLTGVRLNAVSYVSWARRGSVFADWAVEYGEIVEKDWREDQ